MEDELYKKLKKEMDDYKAEIKEKGVDYAIDHAYELTARQEIIDSIEFDAVLDKTEVKALLSRKNLLNELYDDWIGHDGNMREHINFSVDESIRTITKEYKETKIKTKNEAR